MRRDLPPSMRGETDPSSIPATPPGTVLAYLQRERFYHAGESFPRFASGDPARRENDVRLPVYASAPLDASGNATGEVNPPCADCGGVIEWHENGFAPGTRRCAACGALFADPRYSASCDRYAPEDADG